MIIGIAGPAGSGKDTSAIYLVNHHGFEAISFAAGLKRMLTTLGFPEPATQDEKEKVIPWLGVSWRHLAQTLGTEWGRKCVHPDLWVMMSLRTMDPLKNYVVSDVRFENEATAIRSTRAGRIVHLEGRAHAMSEGTKGHASEAGIQQMPGDAVIFNGDNNFGWLYNHLDAVVATQ